MKDYRLSEIKAICEKNYDCEDCVFYGKIQRAIYCKANSSEYCQPYNWDIDEPIKTPSKDDIILAVKQIIWNNGTFDEMGEIVTLDGNDIDHIAEMIAEKFCGGEE